MNIKLWYSKSMKKWRWDLVDEKLDSASGQNTKLRDSLNEIEKNDRTYAKLTKLGNADTINTTHPHFLCVTFCITKITITSELLTVYNR